MDYLSLRALIITAIFSSVINLMMMIIITEGHLDADGDGVIIIIMVIIIIRVLCRGLGSLYRGRADLTIVK